MITRTRIRIATALSALALGGIAACGHAGASAEVTAPDASTTPSTSQAAAAPVSARTTAATTAPSTTATTSPTTSGTASSTPLPPKRVSTQNLLIGRDFTDAGWGRGKVTKGFEGDAGLELSRCSSTPATDAKGYVNLVAWLYQGRQTQGVEMAAGFSTSAQARAYVKDYTATVEKTCPAVLGRNWSIQKVISTTPRGATAAKTWVIREQTSGGPVLRVVSVVTADRRVAVLHLSSTTADPSTTVDLQDLLQSATDRLVRR
jgi:hypothetical protein